MQKQIIHDSAGWYTIKADKRVVFYTLRTKNNLFTGKSVCDEEDVFNAELGKRIAKLRAIREMKKFKIEQLRLELGLANIYLNSKSYDILSRGYDDTLKQLRASVSRIEEKIQKEVKEHELNLRNS